MTSVAMAQLPPPVRPGDRVGIAALSGPVDPARLEAGVGALRGLGFEPVLGANLESRSGLFAGDDDQRLDAFHALVRDPDLKAVIFARGGYGLQRLLPRLNWDLLAAHPRAYVGYSDLTPFLNLVVQRLGLVAFHGPMVAADLARGLLSEEEDSLLGCLAGEIPERYELPHWSRTGEAEGPLLGGCLSLLTASLGTPFTVDLEGAVLFWEEVAEPLYRVDRMLTHLRLSGSLRALAGMAVGHICWAKSERIPGLAWQQLEEINLHQVPGPVGAGLASGHSAPNLTLPLGLRARLSSDEASLIFSPS